MFKGARPKTKVNYVFSVLFTSRNPKRWKDISNTLYLPYFDCYIKHLFIPLAAFYFLIYNCLIFKLASLMVHHLHLLKNICSLSMVHTLLFRQEIWDQPWWFTSVLLVHCHMWLHQYNKHLDLNLGSDLWIQFDHSTIEPSHLHKNQSLQNFLFISFSKSILISLMNTHF